MKTYTVTFVINAIDGEKPLDAAKTVAKWLKDDADKMVFDIVDEETKEAFTVDLSESDEDAVLPNNTK